MRIHPGEKHRAAASRTRGVLAYRRAGADHALAAPSTSSSNEATSLSSAPRRPHRLESGKDIRGR